ncbi:MAG: enoyl-CoA hydratase/isomerase family protein [Phreatobacter sp.]|uniref:FAD-dependent oxidoreductase n=1 Tax=Phreatobacter sp. TaxID=1966341 RepID=UPI001A63E1D7|nr:FAD-dependent oxidoreductase [Phreatobacter sp.]MBL8570505.1 enoyl-CoA hydratase/isomerase family protein [Phreatobacter sp.]
MNLKNFTWDLDSDGLGVLTWDMKDKSMNVIDESVGQDLNAAIDAIVADPAVKGVVLTSAKDTFSGGADLTMLERMGATLKANFKAKGPDAAMVDFFEQTRQFSLVIRKLETCGKPFVAAITGMCLGGGFEITLGCHARIASDNPKLRVGLPEVKVGLFPGAGGTQRVPRMADIQSSLQMLLKGDQLKADRAKAMNLIDEIVPADKLIEAAKARLKAGVDPVKPWDKPKFKQPSGPIYSAAGMMVWPPANAIYRRETYDNFPGARAIMSCVYEGLLVPFDTALKIESRYFAHVLRQPQAHAMIRSLFLSLGALGKGLRRPAGVPPTSLKKVGVIGAGFMGASIAYVTAQAGMDVVLIDRDQESADKGKAHSHKLMTDQVNKGRATSAQREALLAKITATPDYAALADVDLVIEAVFEDPAVKAEVIKKAEAAIRPDVIFASNTSTLPITGLAQNSVRPDQFIGIHFFSPVDKMMLVETIMAEKTGDKALATALDYVKAIRKTPIVVNDTRGFYVNRCVGNYIKEAHLMVMEGVPPIMVDNLAKQAGMPVGPLTLNDEVAIDLGLKILKATKAQVGSQAVDPQQEKLLTFLVEQEGRVGKKAKKGFYDYPDTGKKTIWPGLKTFVGTQQDPDTIDRQEIIDRLLITTALEAARCVEEGVVTDPREADVGSILGFGFAPWSGGTLSYIDNIGAKAFVAKCDALAAKHGDRFAPNKLLREMAAKGETFYGRMAPQKAAA